MSSALQAIDDATKAIPTLTAEDMLRFEEQHWLLLRRYKPQVAKMAHTLAADGKEINFQNQKFVKEW